MRRWCAIVALGVTAGGLVAVSAASPAGAEPIFPINWTVHASTHLAKFGLDVTVPPGSFTGGIDLATGQLSGNLALPPAEMTLTALGIAPLADATFEMQAIGPVTGTANMSTLHVTTTASFAIRISNVSPPGIGVNLAGDSCTTSVPITVTMSGTASLTEASTFTGTYTIPPFTGCQALTPVLNVVMSGPGNTFSATFGPLGTPPPPPPPEPPPLVAVDADVALVIGDQPVALPPIDVAIPALPLPAPGEGPPGLDDLLGWLLQPR